MNQTPAKLEGWSPDINDPKLLTDAMEKAFDYRGDVTITQRDGKVVEGYVFDRTTGADPRHSYVRILPADGSARLTIAYGDIANVKFADRNPASGKSWETWVKKYVEKKLKGEAASIEAEALE
ncbi:MAG: hypothetical protein WC058_16250 [Phycisphaeraceae bacterium]